MYYLGKYYILASDARNKCGHEQEIAQFKKEIKEGDYWMKRATDYYENGNCPLCFETDEGGHKKGCYIKELEERAEKAEQALADMRGKVEEGNIESIIAGELHKREYPYLPLKIDQELVMVARTIAQTISKMINEA